MSAFAKVLRLGTVPDRRRPLDVFAKVTFSDGTLSISGVIGPRSNGDCDGSAGQFIMSFKEYDRRGHMSLSDITPAPGWDAASIRGFFDAWDAWHLNDMRPGCEHQRGSEWVSREVTVYHFRLRDEVTALLRDAKDRAVASIKAGTTFTPLYEETRAANLRDRITHDAPELPPELARDYAPNGPQYTGDSYNRASEVKQTGWLHPEEHPAGLLCKPCQVCGYKYGSAWRREEVPAAVLDFLRALPDADKPCPWRNL